MWYNYLKTSKMGNYMEFQIYTIMDQYCLYNTPLKILKIFKPIKLLQIHYKLYNIYFII